MQQQIIMIFILNDDMYLAWYQLLISKMIRARASFGMVCKVVCLKHAIGSMWRINLDSKAIQIVIN